MIEAAAVGASVRQLRKRARAPCYGAFTQRQGGRVLRQETLALKELRGSACSEAGPNLDGTESSTFFGERRRPIRAGCCRPTMDEPVRRARRNHEQADQREEHVAILPGESFIRRTVPHAPDRTR